MNSMSNCEKQHLETCKKIFRDFKHKRVFSDKRTQNHKKAENSDFVKIVILCIKRCHVKKINQQLRKKSQYGRKNIYIHSIE